MVFYAYAMVENRASDRRDFLITAKDKNTLDAWPRAVGSAQNEAVIRVAADWYTCKSWCKPEIWTAGMEEFCDLVIFTPLHTYGPVTFNNGPWMDPVDGDSFYIRSVKNPAVYCTYFGGDYIRTSTIPGARFRLAKAKVHDSEDNSLLGRIR
ncbi:uncharacterized protein ACLA_076240 [Aspergillus clavatus NRRL 1]|uniref:Uncharacterized protein n=1 Tax=Aspergillus clavatus (strain ATCC 1007 / CBS 513.65 / DSM 816 / NCTC 3887 / NRRL 1 / QM 1276 / 107) TaxID=344612 RepID=A1C863_ASPCL|nr:uncharacterized protein ACLA_076240 [Aspergillus clavatus NRRL 1]EAW14584.1 conserved hypothetical protein [Aspergillus clavatus NRRL 1]